MVRKPNEEHLPVNGQHLLNPTSYFKKHVVYIVYRLERLIFFYVIKTSSHYQRKKKWEQHILVTFLGLHFQLSGISPTYSQDKEYLMKEQQRGGQARLPTWDSCTSI